MIKQIYYQKFYAKENNYSCKNLITQFFKPKLMKLFHYYIEEKKFLTEKYGILSS